MSQDVTTTGNSPLAALSNIAGSIAAAEQVLDVKDGGAYIKFAKGLWTANGEDEILEEDVWALNPFSMIHGFVDFDDSKNVQEKVVPITQPRPDEADLPPAFPTSENGWQPLIGIEMKGVDGDFAGEQFMFKTNSYGGRKCMSDYLKQLQERIATKNPNVVALVSLSKTSYNHAKYGPVFNPVFVFKSWTGIEEDEVKEGAAEAQEAAQEEAPKRRRKAKAKAEPEETVEAHADDGRATATDEQETPEEQPRRRRRRRA